MLRHQRQCNPGTLDSAAERRIGLLRINDAVLNFNAIPHQYYWQVQYDAKEWPYDGNVQLV